MNIFAYLILTSHIWGIEKLKNIMSTNRTSAPNNLSEDDYKRIAKEFADTWYKFIEPKDLDVLIIDRFCNDSIVYVFIDTKFRKLDYYNSL